MTGLLVVLMGFGALSVDLSMLRLAETQAQDVADGAAHAAITVLKRTGDEDLARRAAEEVVSLNRVGGRPAVLTELSFGAWDPAARAFDGAATSNAVRATVSRVGGDGVPATLGRFFGWERSDVVATATSSTQSLQVILVMDITASWHQRNFVKAREAAVAFLDVMHANHGEDDQIGMVVFMNRFGWEFSPFTRVADSAANPSLLRSPWSALNIGSVAGDRQPTWESGSFVNTKHIACRVYGTNNNGNSNPWNGWCTSGSSCYQPSRRNLHTTSTPSGGCFPNMPRYFSDEGGTDHTTGMEMARRMFDEVDNPTTYKAMIVLTDGQPVGYSGSGAGTARVSQGFTESRFREYRRTSSHSDSAIRTDTPALARQMYTDLGVNTWFVSFVEHGTFMEQSAQGDGWFDLAETSAEIVPIFEEIARSLPITIVD
jgi:Mg-chelatase subunit ChlD